MRLPYFRSLEALMEHLESLMSDNRKYSKYFEWSKEMKKVPQPLPHSLCTVCDYLHQTIKKKSVSNGKSFAEWYDPKTRCDVDFVDRLVNANAINNSNNVTNVRE